MNLKEKFKVLQERALIFEEVTAACRKLLLGNHPAVLEAKSYLNGRLSKESQEKYQFGFFPGKKHLDMLTNIVDIEKLMNLNLVYPRYAMEGIIYDKVSLNDHNLVMPYKDVYGNIIAFVGRSLLSDEEMKEKGIPKYKNSQFSKSLNVFGLDRAKSSIITQDHVILVEGQFDCITASEYGFNNVVALGSAALTMYQLALLKRYTNNIYLALDNDNAGRLGVDKILNRYSRIANFKKISFPAEYKDIDAYLKASNSYNALQVEKTKKGNDARKEKPFG